MDPLSEFEAYAAKVDEGMTIDQIAEDFSTDIRSVKERLRYGKVHRDIREAARARRITLDAMKAFACHPCQSTQLRTFQALSKMRVSRPGGCAMCSTPKTFAGTIRWHLRSSMHTVRPRAM